VKKDLTAKRCLKNIIHQVKVGLYKSGMEKYAVVFNGTNTDKSSWFNRNLVLQ
jgi:hypothetical protein